MRTGIVILLFFLVACNGSGQSTKEIHAANNTRQPDTTTIVKDTNRRAKPGKGIRPVKPVIIIESDTNEPDILPADTMKYNNIKRVDSNPVFPPQPLPLIPSPDAFCAANCAITGCKKY